MFCLVALYITQKRAMYFVPEALRPMSLLRKSISRIHSNSHQDMTNGSLSDSGALMDEYEQHIQSHHSDEEL
jgi:hypothetical protein